MASGPSLSGHKNKSIRNRFDACRRCLKQTKQNWPSGEVLLRHLPHRLLSHQGFQESQVHHSSERTLVACSLWLHMGLIGASASAAGLLWLFGGEAEWLSALALAISGGMVAAASWRRARSILGYAERAAAIGEAAPRGPAPRASSRQTGRATVTRRPAIPLQASRNFDDSRRYPTPE